MARRAGDVAVDDDEDGPRRPSAKRDVAEAPDLRGVVDICPRQFHESRIQRWFDPSVHPQPPTMKELLAAPGGGLYDVHKAFHVCFGFVPRMTCPYCAAIMKGQWVLKCAELGCTNETHPPFEHCDECAETYRPDVMH